MLLKGYHKNQVTEIVILYIFVRTEFWHPFSLKMLQYDGSKSELSFDVIAMHKVCTQDFIDFVDSLPHPRCICTME